MENSNRRMKSKKKLSHRDKSKLLNIALIVLALALIVVIVFGTLKDKRVLANNNEKYQEKVTSNSSADNNETSKDLDANVYEKMKLGKPINILVLGDGVGLSEGKSSDNNAWTNLLSNWIKEQYNSDVTITNLSVNKGNVKDGLKALEGNKDNFDLAYIIFGENDQHTLSAKEFKENYENIVQNIKARNDKTVIIPVIENSMRKKSEYKTIIEEIGKSNGLPVLDVAATFTKDPAPYAKLTTKGGIYPNDLGYSLYFTDMKNSIEAYVAQLK